MNLIRPKLICNVKINKKVKKRFAFLFVFYKLGQAI